MENFNKLSENLAVAELLAKATKKTANRTLKNLSETITEFERLNKCIIINFINLVK